MATDIVQFTDGKMPYPMNVMASMIENKLGKDLDIRLSNLKNILEK